MLAVTCKTARSPFKPTRKGCGSTTLSLPVISSNLLMMQLDRRAASHSPNPPAKSYTWTDELQWFRRHFHIVHFVVLVLMPIAACCRATQVPLQRKTLLMALVLYWISATGITVGMFVASLVNEGAERH